MSDMILTTTPYIEGRKVQDYLGIVSGETIIGANVFRDFFASIRDIVGGRAASYEEVLREAKDRALQELEENLDGNIYIFENGTPLFRFEPTGGLTPDVLENIFHKCKKN